MLRAPLFRYVRHLPPKMLIGKLRHAVVSRVLLSRAARPKPLPYIDWPSIFEGEQLRAFAEVFRVHGERFQYSCDKLHDGEFVTNGVSHIFGSPEEVQWTNSVLPTPKYTRWHHDLAFFSYAIPLILADPDRGIPTIAAMIRALDSQLVQNPSELRRFHWSPIAVASRALSLTTALSLTPRRALENHERDVTDIGSHLWRSADVLELGVERYLGFNHAATTEAGLAITLLVQGRVDFADRSIANLVRVLEAGTLSDGLWAERSPAYHIYMLVLVDAAMALLGPTSADFNRVEALSKRMRHAMAAVVHPDGEIAVFNDAGVDDAPTPKAVGWSLSGSPANVLLPEAGFARLSRGGTVVIMDAGPMGPDAAIAHGHADFLSIEVSVGTRRLFVDPGVASISAGTDRMWTRSASSHNGPTLQGCEPAEFFGAWRVGRRGKAWFNQEVDETAQAVAISGECDGYRPWGVTVCRKVTVDNDGRLTIDDQWLDCDEHLPVVTFLVPGDWCVLEESATGLRLQHTDGERVALRVYDGTLARVDRSRYFREGPMRALGATRLQLTPAGATITTIVEREIQSAPFRSGMKVR